MRRETEALKIIDTLLTKLCLFVGTFGCHNIRF